MLNSPFEAEEQILNILFIENLIYFVSAAIVAWG